MRTSTTAPSNRSQLTPNKNTLCGLLSDPHFLQLGPPLHPVHPSDLFNTAFDTLKVQFGLILWPFIFCYIYMYVYKGFEPSWLNGSSHGVRPTTWNVRRTRDARVLVTTRHNASRRAQQPLPPTTTTEGPCNSATTTIGEDLDISRKIPPTLVLFSRIALRPKAFFVASR